MNLNRKQFWEALPKNFKILLLFGQTYDKKNDDELRVSEDKIEEILNRNELNISKYTEYYSYHYGDLVFSRNTYNLEIESLSPLLYFDKLKILSVNGQAINSFSGIENKTELRQLFAIETKVVDLEAIKNLNKLEFLNLRCSKVENINDLPRGIEKLDLTACFSLIDFSPLSKLRRLRNVSLYNTRIENLDCLIQSENLETIDIGGCNIFKLPTLGQFHNLKTLYISKGQVNDTEIQTFSKLFSKCEVSFDTAKDLFGKRTPSEEQKYRDDTDLQSYLYSNDF
jgi:hypothetical protein